MRQKQPQHTDDLFDGPMTLSRFEDILWGHEWSFMAESFHELFQRQQREQELFRLARHNGVSYMRAYAHAQGATICRIKQEAQDISHKHLNEYWSKRLQTAEDTGDAEFDEFRRWVRNHDWYYDYSDDINVWRSGRQQAEKIQAAIKKHGGKYQDFYRYICQQREKVAAGTPL